MNTKGNRDIKKFLLWKKIKQNFFTLHSEKMTIILAFVHSTASAMNRNTKHVLQNVTLSVHLGTDKFRLEKSLIWRDNL